MPGSAREELPWDGFPGWVTSFFVRGVGDLTDALRRDVEQLSNVTNWDALAGHYLGVVAGRLAGGSLEALSLGTETGNLCGLLGDIAYAGHGDAGDVHGDIVEGGVGADGDELP